jgi:arabinogalactan oligomer / maltooligosaccharide transport system substrate-binding protein
MEGKTAMIFDGPYDVKGILTGSKSVFKDNTGNLGIAPIPMGPGGQTGSPLGGQSYVIYAGTAHPAEAYKFISFMSSTSSQAAFAEANHTMPTRQSAYQDGVSSDSVIKDFLSIGDTAVARPPVPEGGYLFDVADPNIWAALTGAQSADEALNQIAYSWKQLGAGNLVSQSTFTPGTSLAACS